MKAIKQYDEIIYKVQSGEAKFGEDGTTPNNWDVFHAYRKAQRVGTSMLDFNDVIWVDRIPEIMDAMREVGIREFTVSCRMSGVQDAVCEFIDCGCQMTGMTLVDTGFTKVALVGDEYRDVPDMANAFMFHIMDEER